MIDELLKFNREFVKNKGYERFITNKYPDKKIAIVSCMDTRLTELLPAALGIKERGCQDHQECWGDYFPSLSEVWSGVCWFAHL